MARIRSIKPSFFKNEELADLAPQVRLLFIGLWTLADKEGKLEDRHKRIKAELFPYDNFDIDQLLSKLQSAGFIVRYEVSELKLIQVINFQKHQRITGTEAIADSEFPDPSEGNILETFGNNEETPRIAGRERKGKEGKGREPDVSIPVEIIYPFETENFKSAWAGWKKYKKDDHKFSFKSPATEQASLKELSELAENDETIAILIIQKSIANGWKGLFKIKNLQNGQAGAKKQQPGGFNRGDIQAELDRRAEVR